LERYERLRTAKIVDGLGRLGSSTITEGKQETAEKMREEM